MHKTVVGSVLNTPCTLLQFRQLKLFEHDKAVRCPRLLLVHPLLLSATDTSRTLTQACAAASHDTCAFVESH